MLVQFPVAKFQDLIRKSVLYYPGDVVYTSGCTGSAEKY
jgi:hypothetical protein